MQQRVQIVDAHNVTGAEFTQLASVDKVVEMNKKWKPAFIYADSGNGSSNIELLHKMSRDCAGIPSEIDTARIKDILVSYDSGAAIEVTDIVTHQKVKKPAKSFMVNCSVRLFEQNKIRISSFDNVLKPQLENYIIARITPNGNPVYGLEKESVGDHRLDAMNLAIVAFQLNFDALHQIKYDSSVGVAADPRTLMKDERGRITGSIERPEPRDLGSEFMSLSDAVLAATTPGRIDLKQIATNRPGWANDEEEKMAAINYQRRMAKQRRQARNISRPHRQNI